MTLSLAALERLLWVGTGLSRRPLDFRLCNLLCLLTSKVWPVAVTAENKMSIQSRRANEKIYRRLQYSQI
jgi:hypothetical protein